MVPSVNLRGVFPIARAALPHMKAKRYGRIVFTSSIAGPRVTSPGHGHDSASKAGINGFIKSAALEFLGPFVIGLSGVPRRLRVGLGGPILPVFRSSEGWRSRRISSKAAPRIDHDITRALRKGWLP